jgi:hypothetical protein
VLPLSKAYEWDMNFPPRQLRIMLGQDEFEELFLAELRRDWTWLTPAHIVYVASGTFRHRHDLVDLLAGAGTSPGYATDPLTSLVVSLIYNYGRSVATAQELVLAWSEVQKREDEYAAFIPSLGLLVEFYLFLDELYVSCGVISLQVGLQRRSPWWQSRPELVVELERWRKRIKRESEDGRQLASFAVKLEQIYSVLRNLERSASPVHSECFVCASALCFASAEIQLGRGAPSAALMLANRASEYLLTAVAVSTNLAGLDGRGVLLRGNSNVGVRDLANALIEEGELGRSKKTDVLLAVNATRNQLSFTHGLGHVRAEDVRDTLTQLANILRSLNPELGWWSKLVGLRPQLVDARVAVGRLLEFDTSVQVLDATALQSLAVSSRI